MKTFFCIFSNYSKKWVSFLVGPPKTGRHPRPNDWIEAFWVIPSRWHPYQNDRIGAFWATPSRWYPYQGDGIGAFWWLRQGCTLTKVFKLRHIGWFCQGITQYVRHIALTSMSKLEHLTESVMCFLWGFWDLCQKMFCNSIAVFFVGFLASLTKNVL